MKRAVLVALLSAVLAVTPFGAGTSAASSDNPISHVFVIQLDNTHMDDLVQMPHLMAFLRTGTIFDNDQSVLNSRTQPDMSSFVAGAYPDKTGIPEQNFFDRGYPATYSYWENHAYVHINNGKQDVDMGHNYILTPNPWQIYNDHGWDVGAIEGHNMALENSSEVRQYTVMNASDKNPNDYRRYGIHCANGSSNCQGASKGTPKNAIFGAPNIPWLMNAPLLDGSGVVGPYCAHGGECFPAIMTLSALYAMQAHGIPVTYGYIHAPHDGFDANTKPYRDALTQEDQAFDLFITRLAGIGTTPANTLFVITSDEGDQFAAGKEHTYGLLGWMRTGTYNFVPDNFNIVDGSAPLVYMKDTEDIPYALESLRGVPHWQYIADQTALAAIHNSNVTDPNLAGRAPSFIMYGEADTWWYGSGNGAFRRDLLLGHSKWDHGSLAPGVNTTWLGLVGPNIRAQELGTFVDQVDGVPTIDYLLGWPLPSLLDGRILFEALSPSALPSGVARNAAKIEQLADAYKQLNAPLGEFAMAALRISTGASLRATSLQGRADDLRLADLVARRNALAPQLQAMVNGAIQGAPIDPAEAAQLLLQYNVLMRDISG
jgi:hypothetical protein